MKTGLFSVPESQSNSLAVAEGYNHCWAWEMSSEGQIGMWVHGYQQQFPGPASIFDGVESSDYQSTGSG